MPSNHDFGLAEDVDRSVPTLEEKRLESRRRFPSLSFSEKMKIIEVMGGVVAVLEQRRWAREKAGAELKAQCSDADKLGTSQSDLVQK